jgi:prepilin-type N-terminal cleavage/methylation domain-containing protein
MRSPTRCGYSLVELCLVLALLALLAGMAGPPVRYALALVRVRAARDLVAGQLARTRSLALSRGGAGMVLDLSRAESWIEASDTATPVVAVADGRLVAIGVDGAAAGRVTIAYDALGLGRVASRTFRFRSGPAEARLTISSYGRVRSW